MFVVQRSDAKPGPKPTILYGYGGFGVPLSPAYSATILAWVEAGGVYAVANLRGGSEEGEQWHRDGMRGNKQNTFDDFHAAAEYLIANNVTTSAQLTISGGSNGGLLVGAALTQRPDLYSAVICAAPLLDMVRYEHHGLGQTWADEYGSARSQRSSVGSTPTPRITMSTRVSRTRRCSLRSLMETAVLTPCMLANLRPRCSTAPPVDSPCCCVASLMSATEHELSAARSTYLSTH